jgi:hypothetical protein
MPAFVLDEKKFVKQYYPAIADVVQYKLHLFIILAIAIS